jgi:pimeloyl-ACP methyl ester carboxylesterase
MRLSAASSRPRPGGWHAVRDVGVASPAETGRRRRPWRQGRLRTAVASTRAEHRHNSRHNNGVTIPRGPDADSRRRQSASRGGPAAAGGSGSTQHAAAGRRSRPRRPPGADLPGARRLALTAADGVRLAGVHLPGPGGPLAVVLAHGFTGSLRRPQVRAAARRLARHAAVVAFDFRGHGASGGASTVGDREILDVEAAVAAARDLGHRQVVTVGFSMGASTALRHAAEFRTVDAVVAVSGPGEWFYQGSVAMRRLHWAVGGRPGRLLTRALWRTRVSARGWDPVPEPPLQAIARLAPIPVLIVHGDRDDYFPVEHARGLAGAARGPVELWVVDGFGHGEAAATPELLDRIGQVLGELAAGRRAGLRPTGPADRAERTPAGPTPAEADPPGRSGWAPRGKGDG